VLGLVRVVEALAALDEDVEDEGDVRAAAVLDLVLDQRLQVAAVDELHREEVRAVGGLGDVEHLHDVRVLEEQREPRLVEEHRDEPRVAGEVRQHALDRDDALEVPHRLGDAAEDLGLAAAAEPLEHRVLDLHRT
jgi:hypothetical protein